MFRFFETIKIESGIPKNLECHQERLSRTIIENYQNANSFNLSDLIIVPNEYKSGIVKCRMEYDITGYSLKFVDYMIKPVETLKIVHCDNIDYSFKYSDRKVLDDLLLQKGNCDDILIVKGDLITDISFANIVFCDSENWFTSNMPLLKGTTRKRLLNSGKITSIRILKSDIKKFSHFAIINAMRGEELIEFYPVSNIFD